MGNLAKKQASSPEEQLKILSKNCVDILPEGELLQKLKEGRSLNIKFGCDPSRPDLHVGHAVVLKKLREFQDLGHKVILIIGDFTATIGDPTGRSKTRPPLTLEETRKNGETYVDQAKLILDFSPQKLQVVYNSEWLDTLSFKEVIKLSSSYTVARMLEREDFEKRYKGNIPISIHEFLYPLVQAYDSYAIKADVELGGTDQTFNLLVGRDIQSAYGLPAQQVVMTMPLIVGLDGKEKMSKSYDNYIGLSEPPEVIYPKIMKVPDTLLDDYFRLLTDIDPKEALRDGPVEAHHKLAEAILTSLQGKDAALAGRKRYQEVAGGGLPTNMPEHRLEKSKFGPAISIVDLIVDAKFAASKSEARRAIQGRGIKIDGELVTDPLLSVSLEKESVLQHGKNRFILIKPA